MLDQWTAFAKPTSPNMQHTKSDITGGNLSAYMQLPLYAYMYSIVILPKTCKHTLMCKIGGLAL